MPCVLYLFTFVSALLVIRLLHFDENRNMTHVSFWAPLLYLIYTARYRATSNQHRTSERLTETIIIFVYRIIVRLARN